MSDFYNTPLQYTFINKFNSFNDSKAIYIIVFMLIFFQKSYTLLFKRCYMWYQSEGKICRSSIKVGIFPWNSLLSYNNDPVGIDKLDMTEFNSVRFIFVINFVRVAIHLYNHCSWLKNNTTNTLKHLYKIF